MERKEWRVKKRKRKKSTKPGQPDSQTSFRRSEYQIMVVLSCASIAGMTLDAQWTVSYPALQRAFDTI